jgi:hypothetical protein
MNLVRFGIAAIAVGLFGFQHGGFIRIGGIRYIFSNTDPVIFDQPKSPTEERHLEVRGDPAQIHSPERGLTVKGKVIEAFWVNLDPKVIEVRRGRIKGNASIVVDNAEAYKTAVEAAKEAGKAIPKAPAEFKVMEADSDLFSYSGSVDAGTVTMPGSWVLKQTTTGIQKATTKGQPDIAYEQTVDATGSSGTLNLAKAKDGSLSQLTTGELAGPVHIKIVRRETPEHTITVKTSSYDIVADKIHINMLTKPGTITAEGHVSLDTVEDVTELQFTEDRVVFSVDENFELLGFKGNGSPGVTTAKTKVGSH